MTETNTETSLAHEGERTVGDVLNAMSAEDRDFFDLIVGAAVDGVDLSEDESIVAQYDALPVNIKYLIDFMVGNVLAENLQHSDPVVNNFLAHFGVKGMQWGKRKAESGASMNSEAPRLSKMAKNTSENRSAARAKVKSGNGTLADAHLAATKSTGHRVGNALLGDKHYWKRQFQITGAVVAGVALATVGVDAMPDGIVSSIGETFAGHGVAGQHVITNQSTGQVSIQSNAQIGRTLLGGTILGVTTAAGYVANTTSQVTNLGRAIFGNKRVDASYAALGKNAGERQTTGSKNVQKVLGKQGGLRKKDLQQSEPLDNFLSHHASASLSLAAKAI